MSILGGHTIDDLEPKYIFYLYLHTRMHTSVSCVVRVHVRVRVRVRVRVCMRMCVYVYVLPCHVHSRNEHSHGTNSHTQVNTHIYTCTPPTHATMCFIKHDITCGIFCFRFGLSVTGMVHPKLILTNANARVGDVLVLTKPIGTGVLTTAMKRGLASQVSY